jgi:hypothetical protein
MPQALRNVAGEMNRRAAISFLGQYADVTEIS